MVRLERKGNSSKEGSSGGHPETSESPGETHTHCQKGHSCVSLSLQGRVPKPLVMLPETQSQSSERSGWEE